MGRPSKSALAATAPTKDPAELSLPPLSAEIEQAARSAENGPAKGALIALETSLNELKRRAISVSDHLGEQYTSILERIQSL